MIYILTGPVHSGKTTLLSRISSSLMEKGFRVGGFLSIAAWKGSGRDAVPERAAGPECEAGPEREADLERDADLERAGYLLHDISGNRSLPFITTTGHASWQRVGPYYVIPEGLELVESILRRARGTDFFVVDEVGPLELSGKGFWKVLTEALTEALSESHTSFILVAREAVLEGLINCLNDLDVLKAGQIEVLRVQEEDVFAHMMEKLTSKPGEKLPRNPP